MASLPTIVPYPRWVAPPPLDRIREGRSRRHQPCPRVPPRGWAVYRLARRAPAPQVWCVRGHRYPGGAVQEWGFRGHLWYYRSWMPPRARPLSHASQPPSPAWPQVDAGTLHRLLSRVARRFGLSAEHQAKLAARGYDVADCGPEARHVFASLPADKAERVAVANWLLSDAYTRTTEADLLGVHGFAAGAAARARTWPFLPAVAGSRAPGVRVRRAGAPHRLPVRARCPGSATTASR